MQTKNTQRFEFSHCLHAQDGETDRNQWDLVRMREIDDLFL